MVRGALLASAVAIGEAGTLSVSYEDCGAKHAHVDSLSPLSISTGATETVTGTGTSDEEVTSAHFTASVSALGAKLADCSGDGTKDIVCSLPMGVGKITVKALSFPIEKGTVSIPVEVQTSAAIPASLANVDVHVEATDQNGESVVCLDVHTAKALSASGDFETFKAKYGKVYNGDEDDHKATYEANMKKNDEHNSQNLGFELGENQFSDLTQEQYRVAAGLGYKQPPMAALPFLGVHEYNGEELAASVDWTTKGAVTGVKDQGQCGSCWAFSSTGGMEGAWEIASGRLQELSEQQLVDCSKTGNAGCQGGDMGAAFEWAEANDLATEDTYPYSATDGSCKTSGFTTAIPAGGITGYKRVGNMFTGASKSSLQSAIQQQPVSIAIEADQYSFQAYSGGVLSSGCGTSLDHGVLAVGYGSENNNDYWLVKNSWGSSWGSSGYIKISSASNVCGVLSQPVYPTVSASVAV